MTQERIGHTRNGMHMPTCSMILKQRVLRGILTPSQMRSVMAQSDGFIFGGRTSKILLNRCVLSFIREAGQNCIDLTQVLRLDHRFLIAHSIRLDIEDYDDLIASQKDPSYLSSADNDEDLDNDLDVTLHVKLGAAQNEQTFAALEQEHASDNAFNRFRIKLANFLSDSLPAHGIPLPGGKRIKFMPDETVCHFVIF